MSSVISAALAYLASWFQSRHAMQLEILALRHQLAVYQNSVKRPQLQPADRFFWAWFSRLWWSGWQHTLEFVQPRTVLAWQKKRFRDYWRRLSQSGKPGRPTVSKEVRDLIRDMWCSNPTWGSPRIVGELRKLGITVAKSTVEKYRPRDRKPPSPMWKAFLSNHVKDIVACDFLVVSQTWRSAEINVTLGLVSRQSLTKEWLMMTFIAVRCPNCQSDQIVKRGKTARRTQRYLCQNRECAADSFLLDYRNRGWLPEVKQLIIDMSLVRSVDRKEVLTSGQITG